MSKGKMTQLNQAKTLLQLKEFSRTQRKNGYKIGAQECFI